MNVAMELAPTIGEIVSPSVGFDFAALAAEMQQDADSGLLWEIAAEVLAPVFRFTDDDGEVRTFEQIDAETEAIWSNPLVQQIDGLAAKIAQRHAEFCGGHGRGSSLGGPNEAEHPDYQDGETHGKHNDIDDEDDEDEDDKPHRPYRGDSRRNSSLRRQARRHVKMRGSWIFYYAVGKQAPKPHA